MVGYSCWWETCAERQIITVPPLHTKTYNAGMTSLLWYHKTVDCNDNWTVFINGRYSPYIPNKAWNAQSHSDLDTIVNDTLVIYKSDGHNINSFTAYKGIDKDDDELPKLFLNHLMISMFTWQTFQRGHQNMSNLPPGSPIVIVSRLKGKPPLVAIDAFPFEYFWDSQEVFLYKNQQTRMNAPDPLVIHTGSSHSRLETYLHSGPWSIQCAACPHWCRDSASHPWREALSVNSNSPQCTQGVSM